MDSAKAGDVVFLNSGGPAMTVVRTEEEKEGKIAGCVWFCEDGTMEQGKFLLACLTRDEDAALNVVSDGLREG